MKGEVLGTIIAAVNVCRRVGIFDILTSLTGHRSGNHESDKDFEHFECFIIRCVEKILGLFQDKAIGGGPHLACYVEDLLEARNAGGDCAGANTASVKRV